MKKLCWLVTSILTVGLFLGLKANAEEMPSMMDLIEESKLEASEPDRPKSAILIDANTGKVLWGENQDAPHNPASIMKLMVMYLTYEAMEKGDFNLDTTVTATERQQQISNIYEISNNKIVAGVEYPVKELIPMALVPSSNAATIMLAELVEPDANKFLELMNQKAQELGMTQTKIVNATGAEISSFQGLYAIDGVDVGQLNLEGSNESTAHDFAIFTYHLLKKYPEILEYTKTPTRKVMEGTPYEEEFETYNYSIPGLEYSYEGVDGLKTGSSSSGAFNIDITAQRGNLRLIALVFGVGNWEDQTGEYKRHPYANAILDYGFNHFEYKEVLPAGEQTINDKKVIVETAISDVVKKDDMPSFKLDEENKTVVVENNLTQVSPTIKEQSAKFEDVKLSLVEETKEQTSSFMTKIKDFADFSNPIIKWFAISIAVLLLLMIIIISLLIRDSRRKKRARQNRGDFRR